MVCNEICYCLFLTIYTQIKKYISGGRVTCNASNVSRGVFSIYETLNVADNETIS